MFFHTSTPILQMSAARVMGSRARISGAAEKNKSMK